MPRDSYIWAEASLRVTTPTGPGPWAEQWLRSAGVVLFLLGAQALTVLTLAAALVPEIRMRTGAISDLGVHASTAVLLNASLVAAGLLNILAGWLIHRALRSPLILALHLLAGIGAIGAGLMTLDRSGLHGLFLLAALLGLNLQTLSHVPRLVGPMCWIGAVLGLLGLGFLALLAVGDAGAPAWFGAIGPGGMERMIVYTPMIWLLALGGHLMAWGGRPKV